MEVKMMLYCPKCQVLCTDRDICPSCGGKKLREPEPDDPTLLITANEIKAEMIESAFEEHNMIYEERICGLGGPPSAIFGKITNTNKNIFVPFSELDKAAELLNGIGILDESDAVLSEEEEEEEDEETDSGEMNPRKKGVWRIVSAILFILAVWGIVTVADYAANAMKAFLTSH
jgi:hypothetical protein